MLGTRPSHFPSHSQHAATVRLVLALAPSILSVSRIFPSPLTLKMYNIDSARCKCHRFAASSLHRCQSGVQVHYKHGTQPYLHPQLNAQASFAITNTDNERTARSSVSAGFSPLVAMVENMTTERCAVRVCGNPLLYPIPHVQSCE